MATHTGNSRSSTPSPSLDNEGGVAASPKIGDEEKQEEVGTDHSAALPTPTDAMKVPVASRNSVEEEGEAASDDDDRKLPSKKDDDTSSTIPPDNRRRPAVSSKQQGSALSPSLSHNEEEIPVLDLSSSASQLNASIATMVHESVEPLPAFQRSHGEWLPSVPGAHPVAGGLLSIAGGHPLNHQEESHEGQSTTTVRNSVRQDHPQQQDCNGIDHTTVIEDDMDEDEAVIDGAVVVDSGDEEAQAQCHQADDHQRRGQESGQDDPTEVLEGTIMDEQSNDQSQTNQQHHCWFVLLLLSFLVGGGLAALLVLTLDPSSTTANAGTVDNNDQGEDVQQAINITEPFDPEILTPAMIRAIGEEGSHLQMANQWMKEDPNLDTYSPERQFQRFILAGIYLATQGDEWIRNDHWLSYTVHECQWYTSADSSDFVCDDAGENMVVANLSSNNLQGTLPITSTLPFLRIFDVSHNNIGGLAPLHTPPTLEVIDISYNKFTENRVATGAWQAFGIRVIKTNSNMLRGTLTGNLLQFLPSLEVWNATDNLYEGILPSALAYCQNLTYWGIGHNTLITGSIPTELGLIPSLRGLDVSGNDQFGGVIPTSLGLLSQLTHLDLAGTSMSGEIPDELCVKIEEGTLMVNANCSLIRCC